jgi:hypothetical protein
MKKDELPIVSSVFEYGRLKTQMRRSELHARLDQPSSIGSWFRTQGLGWGSVLNTLYEEGVLSTSSLIAVTQNKEAMEHLVTEANPYDLHSIRQIINPETQKPLFEKAIVETINTRSVAIKLLQSGQDPFYYAVAQGLMHPSRLENILSNSIEDRGSHLLYTLRDITDLALNREKYVQISRLQRYIEKGGAELIDYNVVAKKLYQTFNSASVYKALRRRDRRFANDDNEMLRDFMYSGWLNVSKARKAIPALPPYRYVRDRVLPAVINETRRDFRNFKHTWKKRFTRLSRSIGA